MDMHVYYKDSEGKLHMVEAEGVSDVNDTFVSVAEMAWADNHKLLRPILGVIQGGKQ